MGGNIYNLGCRYAESWIIVLFCRTGQSEARQSKRTLHKRTPVIFFFGVILYHSNFVFDQIERFVMSEGDWLV